MYHVTEFVGECEPEKWPADQIGFGVGSPIALWAAYTTDTFPQGKVTSRDGNAVRVVDPDRRELEMIVSRPRAEGDIFPLPLYKEDLSWAFE